MPATDTYPLVDRIVTGGLPAFLTEAREAGESHETIAYRLRSEHDITVSAETVRKWCARVDSASSSSPEGVDA